MSGFILSQPGHRYVYSIELNQMARIRISLVLVLTLALGTTLFSCKSEQPDFLNENDVVADIVHHVDFDDYREGDCSTPVLEVVLENKTLKADSYLWDFGDGTTSHEVNPKKVYAKSGSYTVKLTAYFSDDTVQIEKPIIVVRNSDGTGPVAQLAFQRSNATSLEGSFEITTDEPVYTLFFGDGNVIKSNEKLIKHQYGGPLRYSALLIIENSEGCTCASTLIDLSH